MGRRCPSAEMGGVGGVPLGESRGILVLTKRESGAVETAGVELIGTGRKVPTDIGEVGSGRSVPTDLGETAAQPPTCGPAGAAVGSKRGDTGGRRVPTEIGETQAGGGRSVPTDKGDTQAGGRKEPTEQGETGAARPESATGLVAASRWANDSSVREPRARVG